MTEMMSNNLVKIKAKLGEIAEDYLIIIKPEKNTIAYIASDYTWGIGAVERFKTFVCETDKEQYK